LSLLIITGLLAKGTLEPNVLPNGTRGSNINAVPAVPTIFKKSKRETEPNPGISFNT
jgi:hypothetical protein